MIDAALVRRLVATQFAHWADLPVRPVEPGGWDHRTYRLGEQLVVRLPSAEDYAAQVEKEHRWLPLLAPLLPLPIPAPVAIGEPAQGYPWRWSIRRWLEGEPAASGAIADLCGVASDLAQFLLALQRIDAADGPPPGPHNFYRGGSLAVYDVQTRQAIELLRGRIDANSAIALWDAALASAWREPPVWIHGDVSAGNLLLQDGRLRGVIDFGLLGVGDPACDLSIAWTLFKVESRQAFRDQLGFDAATWARARGWTLWKALIVTAGLADTNAVEAAQASRTLDELFAER